MPCPGSLTVAGAPIGRRAPSLGTRDCDGHGRCGPGAGDGVVPRSIGRCVARGTGAVADAGTGRGGAAAAVHVALAVAAGRRRPGTARSRPSRPSSGCSLGRGRGRHTPSDLRLSPRECVPQDTFGVAKCVPGEHISRKTQAGVYFSTALDRHGTPQVGSLGKRAYGGGCARADLSKCAPITSTKIKQSWTSGPSGRKNFTWRGLPAPCSNTPGIRCSSTAPPARHRVKRQAHVDFLDSLGLPE